ncbi:MAG TPA: hypothetical protein VG028_00150 [Terriglobia bacterium]|nr:hypothetical protein [Terriglobia bacterium]
MATIPQPPRPPAPPAPPRTGSHVIAIALLVLAFIVLVSLMGIWVGFRILTHGLNIQVNDQGGDKKEVSIKTPFGGIEVNKGVNEASLGLPIYPGAKTVSDHNDATVNMQFGDNMARIVVGKFETPDAFDKVKDFYQERLTAREGKFIPKSGDFDSGHWGKEDGNFIRRDREGRTVFEIKRSESEKVVSLKDEGSTTRIELVRISHGKEETN